MFNTCREAVTLSRISPQNGNFADFPTNWNFRGFFFIWAAKLGWTVGRGQHRPVLRVNGTEVTDPLFLSICTTCTIENKTYFFSASNSNSNWQSRYRKTLSWWIHDDKSKTKCNNLFLKTSFSPVPPINRTGLLFMKYIQLLQMRNKKIYPWRIFICKLWHVSRIFVFLSGWHEYKITRLSSTSTWTEEAVEILQFLTGKKIVHQFSAKMWSAFSSSLKEDHTPPLILRHW